MWQSQAPHLSEPPFLVEVGLGLQSVLSTFEGDTDKASKRPASHDCQKPSVSVGNRDDRTGQGSGLCLCKTVPLVLTLQPKDLSLTLRTHKCVEHGDMHL